MVRLATVLVALGACSYSPTAANSEVTPDGPGVDPDGPPIDMDPDPQPGDGDGDGIDDGDDSCPDDFDPNERDHDGDGIGDPCDRCPVVMDAADPDMDGDGVGDKCDPEPNAPGHTRVAFVGFFPENAALVSTWTTSGSWQILAGQLTQTPSANVDAIVTSFDVERAFVMTRMRIDDFSSTTAAAGYVLGLVGTAASPTAFHQCAISPQNGGLINAKRTGQSTGDVLAWSGSLATTTTVDMVGNLRGGQLTCKFTDATMTQTVDTSLGTTVSGSVALLSQTAGVSYDYLFVVTGP